MDSAEESDIYPESYIILPIHDFALFENSCIDSKSNVPFSQLTLFIILSKWNKFIP